MHHISEVYAASDRHSHRHLERERHCQQQPADREADRDRGVKAIATSQPRRDAGPFVSCPGAIAEPFDVWAAFLRRVSPVAIIVVTRRLHSLRTGRPGGAKWYGDSSPSIR